MFWQVKAVKGQKEFYAFPVKFPVIWIGIQVIETLSCNS